MIIPKVHKDSKGKVISGLFCLGLCLLGYIILAYAEVPEIESSKIYMREINELNITRFTPPPEPELQAEEEQPREAEETQTETEPVEVREAPKRVNLDEALPEGLKVDLTVDRRDRQPARQQIQNSESRSLRLEDSEIELAEGGMKTLLDRSVTSRRGDRRSPGSPQQGSGIAAAEGQALSGGSGGIESGVGTILSGPRGRQGSDAGIEVGLKDLEDFGENYSELDYNAIVEWMKDNPAELPVPVRRLMCDGTCDPSYLTSRIPFQINQRQFDLLLMVIEQNVEIHIFLVEEMDATYLVDSRFREISNRLRKGGIGVLEDDIVEVDSQMRPAGQEQTQEFYGIFLSWWESVKSDYENQ